MQYRSVGDTEDVSKAYRRGVRLAAALLLAAAPGLVANELSGYRLEEKGSDADLVLEFKEAPRFKLIQSGSQDLFVVDLLRTIFRDTRSRLRPATKLAEYAVISQYDKHTVRVVVKRDPAARIEVDRKGKRLTLQVRPPGSGLRPRDRPQLAVAPAASAPAAAVTFPSQLPGAKPRVVIDPGHGGRDPGAVGTHTTDKEIALAVGLELKALLEADDRLEVHYTRTKDRFVPLEERGALAQRVGAEVFVSLHANAATDRAHGFEVWYLSSRASRSEARRLLRGAGDPEAGPANSLIQQIIVDKQREGTQNKSSLLAGYMNQALSKTGQRSRGVGEENFAVLRSVAVPSVLIELGFLSNAREEKRLMDPAFQKKQAQAIHDGLVAYLQSQGLLGNRLPAKTLYAVRHNDSLSVISQRFGVDLVDLASANGLGKDAPLYVGQLLEIPTDPVAALIGEHIE